MPHQPVLLKEVLEYLAIKPDGVYFDATFGRGGHSREILQRLGPQGRLFAIDKDPEAIQAAKADPLFDDPRFAIQQSSFTQLYPLIKQAGKVGSVDGILLDLGVSSPQLDDPTRGFSFLRDGPLDMRMNPQQGLDAASWLKTVSEQDLAHVLKEYGEERYARRIAAAIIKEREQAPIKTTGQLAEIVAKAHPRWEHHKHPATRSFQAIRIYINGELEELPIGLEQCLEVLAVGGRLLVITFHSLEDRIVKNFLQKHTSGGNWPARLPVTQAEMDLTIRLKRINGAIRPSDAEVGENPRARSAALRVMEKRR